MSIRHVFLIVLAAGIAGLLGVWASAAVYGPGSAGWFTVNEDDAAIGAVVAPFTLTDISGTPRTLPRAGRPQLINYWASWCAPCREEMPLLDGFARAQGASGIEVVGIALDKAADARAFLAQTPVSFPQMVEPAGPADSSVNLGNRRSVLPYSVLIDDQGRLVKRRYGAFRSASDLQQWISGAD